MDTYPSDSYKKRTDFVSGFLVQDPTNNGEHYIHEFVPSPHSTTIDLKFLPHRARIVATNEQGLAVFEAPHSRFHRTVLYHVCKLTTKQVLALPNPKTRMFQTAMVAVVTIGSNPLHYKILRLSETSFTTSEKPVRLPFTYNCEIFDSKEWEWKVLAPLALPYGVTPANTEPITTSSGSIYMLLTNGDILKFDANSGKQTTLSPPPDYQPDDDHTRLVKCEGKLGLAFRTPNDSWEIWVHTNDGSWMKLCSLDLNRITKRAQSSLVSFYDSDTFIISKDYDKLAFYKFTRDMDQEIKLSKILTGQIFSLHSDFETVNLKDR
uniref:uncharacterized protein LOC122610713 n=1 Tax=Erigeron canadensis TaxID=72917 RepID=UPI001CB95A1F|nr:uncharacterized protein LOC122610713 [Erigeron canadensis]